MNDDKVCLFGCCEGSRERIPQVDSGLDSPRYKRSLCKSADLGAHFSISECKTKPDARLVAVVIFADTDFEGCPRIDCQWYGCWCGRVDSDGRPLGLRMDDDRANTPAVGRKLSGRAGAGGNGGQIARHYMIYTQSQASGSKSRGTTTKHDCSDTATGVAFSQHQRITHLQAGLPPPFAFGRYAQDQTGDLTFGLP